MSVVSCGLASDGSVAGGSGLGVEEEPSSATHQEDRRADSPHLPLCAGCSLRIADRFYLNALEQKWHAACLKCAECGVELDHSCFERNGNIFCKEDYLR